MIELSKLISAIHHLEEQQRKTNELLEELIVQVKKSNKLQKNTQ